MSCHKHTRKPGTPQFLQYAEKSSVHKHIQYVSDHKQNNNDYGNRVLIILFADMLCCYYGAKLDENVLF